MFRLRGFFVVALLCSAVLWSTSIALAQTPAPTPSTWGTIKAMYGVSMSPEMAPRLIPGSHDWSNNTKSEAFYALDRSRNGYSNLYYQNCAMGDWDYPHSDGPALADITRYFNAPTGPLGKWNGFQQGGECIFFADQVLYRSSFGYGDGYHLVIPKGTNYTYATRSTREAGIGWVLQSATMPHTAIVVAVYASGLDVVDSNWTGGAGSYAISRHLMTWSKLDGNGFKAYSPWVDGYKNGNWGLWHP